MQDLPPSANHFLRTLSAEDRALLVPLLETVNLAQGQTLFSTGDSITAAYFPHLSIVSLVVEFSDGRRVETGIVGRNGVVGGGAALDGRIAIDRAFVQVAGRAEAVKIKELRRLASQSETLRPLLVTFDQMALAQAQQTAGCNALHSLEERLSRWLLHVRDLLGSNTLPLTQEFLAIMLATQRTSVTVVARSFQQAGMIKYHRGTIEIVDSDGLEETACECYNCLNENYVRLGG